MSNNVRTSRPHPTACIKAFAQLVWFDGSLLCFSPPPALPPKKRQSAPSPTRVAVVAPMSRATSGSSLPVGINRQVITPIQKGRGQLWVWCIGS